jgi:tetratricopeptide (TPR) repeat protein
MKNQKQFYSILAMTVFLFASQSIYPQSSRKNVFADPKNLQVLPADISPDELRQTMMGFVTGLNAKCSYCHMVDDNLTMPDPDYSDDAKLTKRTAREMLKMVADINGRISNIDFLSQQPRVEVTCITCHRGQYRPLLILPVLTEARAEGGVDAVIAKYSELRELYYGNHTYDLRPSTLSGFARSIASEGDVDGAIKLLNFANESFPDEERVLFNLARAYQQKGNKDQAVMYLRRLVYLFPDSSFYAKQLNLAEKEKDE